MPKWLRLVGLALVIVPLLLLWARPDFFVAVQLVPVRMAPPPLRPSPPTRRALPNAERCVVIETVPGGVDIGFTAAPIPTARTHVLWWCDDDRVYWS